MNIYEGLCCPVCHDKLFAEDDIVVCPICGAPHHRECYKISNHCTFEESHGTDEQWTRPQIEKIEEAVSEQDKKVCKLCGSTLPADSLFCSRCGTKYGDQRASGNGGAPYIPLLLDPLGGVKSDELIDGVTATEISAYVAVNTGRYVSKFKELSKKGHSKASWNFGSFLFAPYWLFYRKCYKEGMLALFVFAVYTALSIPFIQTYNLMARTYSNLNFTQLSEKLIEKLSGGNSWQLVLALIAACILIAFYILLGIFGDLIYKKNAIAKIKELKKTSPREDYSYNLQKHGGVNLMVPAIIWGLISLLSMFL